LTSRDQSDFYNLETLGNSEWTGAWGDGSPEMEKYKPQILAYIKSLPEDEQF